MRSEQWPPLFALVHSFWPSWAMPTDPDSERATVAAWSVVLGRYDYDDVVGALTEISNDGDLWPPPPGVLANRTAGLVRRRASATSMRRGLPMGEAPDECGLCGDSGWMPADVVGGSDADAVQVCRCSAGQRIDSHVDSHERSCTCLDCSYGVKRAFWIRRGYDGAQPPKTDPLTRIGSQPSSGEEF